MEDYYQILGVTPTATQEEITRRYRFLVLAYHPDRFSNETKAEASREMARINKAYEVLSDPLKRAAYDRQRSNQYTGHGTSGGDTTHNTGKYEASQSGTYRAGYQENTNRINEAFQYYKTLISRWEPFIQNISHNPERDLILHRCKDLIRAISEKLSDCMGNQGKALFLEEMDNYLAAIIVINVALGIELSASSPPAGYTGQDLMEYSMVPMRSQISFVLDYGKSRGVYTQDQVISLNQKIATELRALCQAYQQEGRAIAAVLRDASSRTSRHKENNSSKSRPLIQFCQSCGSIGPTKKLTFIRMIGLLVFAHFRRVSGELCAACAVKYFWEFTGMTILLGWISVFIVGVPFILLANWINYLKSGDIRKNAAGLTEIAGGWKAFTILAILLAIIVVFAYTSTSNDNYEIQSSNASSYDYQPVLIPRKTSTAKPIPTSTSFKVLPVLPTDDGCLSWDEVTISYKDKKLCVYGIVKDAYWGDPNRFFITFSSSTSAFRMIVLWGYYYKDVIGECVEATGIIKTYGNMPYMELGKEITVYNTTARCLK